MSSLLELPIELLVLILEKLGGRELRRGQGSARLTVCKTWYSTALSIYLSGFGTSNIQLYGHNIDGICKTYGHADLQSHRHLMHKNTRNLRIHLLGHPWDKATAQADEDGEYTTWNLPPYDSDTDQSLISKAVEDWRDAQLKPCLDDLFSDLRHFEALQDVIVEARSEPVDDFACIPQRDYIYVDTISRLPLNLPLTHNLVSFTLDTYGTELLGTGHACDMLADVLPRIEIVRIRMARLCPSVFATKKIRAGDLRLKSLIIKLYSPLSGSTAVCGSAPCAEKPPNVDLSDSLTRASRSYLTNLDNLSSNDELKSRLRLRISYIPATFPCVQVIECRSLTRYRLRDGGHACEDDGKPCWFEMEDVDMLIHCGPYS